MPGFISYPEYKTPKSLTLDWKTFTKGLNTLLRENEINKDEMSQADNIILKGKGVPTKRWGTDSYYTSSTTGSVRGLKGYYTSSVNELLAITDEGYLTIKDGTSFTARAGVSWASGMDVYMAQLDNKMYILNGQREMARYSSPTLVGFTTVSVPASLGASNLSNATGATTKSYRVSAISAVGETLASTPLSLASQPQDLGGTNGGVIRVAWGVVANAEGYNVYGRDDGAERFLGFVSDNVFMDDGSAVPKEFTFPPSADSTGGPLAKYVVRFQDRLVIAGFPSEGSKLLVSGRAPNQEKFDLASGGNYLKIEPDAGDDIVQICPFRDRVVVFKEKSIWRVNLTTQQIGNFFVTIPVPELVTNSDGCIAPRSVVAVENDIFYLSRKGVRTLGYEPGLSFDVLRSNEVSVKVGSFFKGLDITQLERAVATYFDNKYMIAFPGINKMMVFDRERVAWLGPWSIDGNVFEKYYDSDNNETLLMGKDDGPGVVDFNENYTTDEGSTIATTMRTKKEDFGDFTSFKNIKNLFTQFRNVSGNVDVEVTLEERNGNVVTSESFNINPNLGNSGWGADMWADAQWGDTGEDGGGTDITDIIRWVTLNRSARTMQITVKTSSANDNYELLGFRGDANVVQGGFRPDRWLVT